MTVMINFNVRNPDWYWPPEKMKESGNYYEEFKAINEDKIPKHIPCWAYKVSFDVKDVKENREAEYELKYTLQDSPETIQSHIVKDMTHVIFTGNDEKLEVVVANEIMHSFMGAKQSGKKYYWYFYIKADAEYSRFTDMIWISQSQWALL